MRRDEKVSQPNIRTCLPPFLYASIGWKFYVTSCARRACARGPLTLRRSVAFCCLSVLTWRLFCGSWQYSTKTTRSVVNIYLRAYCGYKKPGIIYFTQKYLIIDRCQIENKKFWILIYCCHHHSVVDIYVSNIFVLSHSRFFFFYLDYIIRISNLWIESVNYDGKVC